MNYQLSTKKGQALIIAVFFFVVISGILIIGISSALLQGVAETRGFIKSAESFYISEAGLEDGFYRLIVGKQIDTAENVPVGDEIASVVVNDLSGNKKEVISTGDKDNRIRKTRMTLTVGAGASFNFGVQTDVGGLILENSSSVNGNAFSNGSITGSGNNLISVDAISAGETGYVEGVNVGGSVRSNTISNSTIGQDAYYQIISGTIVGGTEYPDSEDQATSTLPISDEDIDGLKQDAEAGGVVECEGTETINTNQTIGPVKYTCNVEIRNNPSIVLAGAVWVEGDLTFKNSPTFTVDPALEGESVPVIVDNPSDRLTSSRIDLQNSGFFDGAGSGSYVVLISQNESAENGGVEKAISITNGANGDILVYSGHGEVLLKNNVDLKEVSAYRVRLQNSAEVTYETGLVNLLFTSGPGASFGFDSWQEIE